jgi:ribosomal protein S18 acetylase RimI-like enzyme
MAIRACNEADWEVLKALRLAALIDSPTAFGVSYAAIAMDSEQQWRARASSHTEPRFLLAFAEGRAVGMIGDVVDLHGQFNLIAMWLQPDARGSGIAGELVEAVKTRAVARQYDRVVLSVSPDNLRAANFYRKHGFAFLPEWEALASHPEIQVQKMRWLATSSS